jgi:DNA-binding LacI/PurR family transcriptional regulator
VVSAAPRRVVRRQGGTGSIGVVVPSSELEGFRGPFVGAPLQGASSVISASHRQPVLLLVDGGRDPDVLVHYLAQGHVDAAVVILLHETEQLFRSLRDIGLPIVYVGRSSLDLGDESWWVDGDNYAGARLATRALVEAGRRRLVTITGPMSYLPAVRRLEGFRDELAAWGLEPVAVANGDFTMQSGSMAMANLMHAAPDADGLFASSDLLAAGALRVLTASGRRVPQDLSVVGFDDTVVAATSAPALTSVRQPLREMGARAAELAIEALQDLDGAKPRHCELPMTLTVRDSI